MQKNKKRKGFTLTELAIVIAVIAILIAVLVPTFTSLINKAKESSDQQTVKNLNTALTVDEAINGKPANIDEVLEVAENAGYKVENLTPASDSSLIVWNETDNQFEYVKADELSTTYTSNQSTIWLITSSYDKENADFSQYISGTITEDLTVSAGISVGSNSDINISYEDSTEESVTFVTNGGTLTLNNANATVTHYGTADTVNVEAVDENNSYHLNGEVVGNINVTKGHVVIEANAVIPTIIVTSSEVTIQINSTSVITIATTDSNLVSTLSNIVSGNKTNVTVVDQVCDSTAISYFAGGLGTETSPYLISNTTQWLNFKKYCADNWDSSKNCIDGGFYFNVTSDLDFSNVTESYYIENFTGSIDFGGNTISGLNNSLLYDSRWLFENVYSNKIASSGIRCETTISNLTIEHNDTALVYLVSLYFGYYDSDLDDVILSNITTTGSLSVTDNNTTPFVFATTYTNTYAKLQFNDCTNETFVTSTADSAAGLFIGTSYSKAAFTNCVNKGTLIHTTKGYASMLIGNSCSFDNISKYGGSISDKVTVSGCVNYGTIIATDSESSYSTNLLCGNGWGDLKVSDMIQFVSDNSDNLYNAGSGICQKATVSSLSSTSSNTIDISAISGYTYKYTVTFRLEAYANAGDESASVWGSTGITFTFKSGDTYSTIYSYDWISYWDLTDEQKATVDAANATTVTIGDKTVKTLVIDETTYIILDSSLINGDFEGYEYLTMNSGVGISGTLLVYNANGELTGYYSYSY